MFGTQQGSRCSALALEVRTGRDCVRQLFSTRISDMLLQPGPPLYRPVYYKPATQHY